MNCLSFYEISNLWLSHKQMSIKYLTFDKYEKIINKHLAYFNDKNIDEINEEDIQEFFRIKKDNEGLSSSTLRTIRQVLKSIFDYSKEQYHINVLSIDTIKVKKEKNESEILTLEQKDLLNIYIYKNNNPLGIAILLALYSGLRTGEICALRKEDIDLKNNIIHVHKTVERIKNNQTNKSELVLNETRSHTTSRKIPLSQFVKHYLKRYFQEYQLSSQDFLISQSEKLYEPRTLQTMLKTKCLDFHVKVDFRMLRNTFISYCLENNMNIKCLCETVGISDLNYIYDLCPECNDKTKNKEINRVLNFNYTIE